MSVCACVVVVAATVVVVAVTAGPLVDVPSSETGEETSSRACVPARFATAINATAITPMITRTARAKR